MKAVLALKEAVSVCAIAAGWRDRHFTGEWLTLHAAFRSYPCDLLSVVVGNKALEIG
jgi:hypothetical protein